MPMGQQEKDGDREDSLGKERNRGPCGPHSMAEAPLHVHRELLPSQPQSPASQVVCIMNYPKDFSLEELKITFKVCACSLPPQSSDLTTCMGSAWVVLGMCIFEEEQPSPHSCLKTATLRAYFSPGGVLAWLIPREWACLQASLLIKLLWGCPSHSPENRQVHRHLFYMALQ